MVAVHDCGIPEYFHLCFLCVCMGGAFGCSMRGIFVFVYYFSGVFSGSTITLEKRELPSGHTTFVLLYTTNVYHIASTLYNGHVTLGGYFDYHWL